MLSFRVGYLRKYALDDWSWLFVKMPHTHLILSHQRGIVQVALQSSALLFSPDLYKRQTIMHWYWSLNYENGLCLCIYMMALTRRGAVEMFRQTLHWGCLPGWQWQPYMGLAWAWPTLWQRGLVWSQWTRAQVPCLLLEDPWSLVNCSKRISSMNNTQCQEYLIG